MVEVFIDMKLWLTLGSSLPVFCYCSEIFKTRSFIKKIHLYTSQFWKEKVQSWPATSNKSLFYNIQT